MTNNQQNLLEAQSKAKEFQDTLEPEAMKEAYSALENVLLLEEDDLTTRDRMRTGSLYLWLRLIQLVDDHIAADFDPDDVPERSVEPPRALQGVADRPGADPARIKDPLLRAEYEEAIAAHRAKTRNYRLQIHLRRLDERITPRVEDFIREYYAPDSDDQRELRIAIDTTIKKSERKEDLLKLLTPPQS